MKISLKCVPKGPIDNNSAFVQAMAWSPTGGMPLHEPMPNHFIYAYMCHQGNMKMSFYQYRNSHYKNKMVSQASYFYNGNSYTWKGGLYIKISPLNSMSYTKKQIFTWWILFRSKHTHY